VGLIDSIDPVANGRSLLLQGMVLRLLCRPCAVQSLLWLSYILVF